MSHHVPGLPWTEEQWAEVNQVVQDAARKARVASSFLPLVGPLPPGQASVPALAMNQQTLVPATPAPGDWRGPSGARLYIDDGETLKLITIACLVYLTTQQAEDPGLASAKQMLARAAVVLSRLEDSIVFNGQAAASTGPPTGVPPVRPAIYSISGGQHMSGLFKLVSPGPRLPRCIPIPTPKSWAEYGEFLVPAVVDAINALEERGQYGPFACIFGNDVYRAANRPTRSSMVLPSDRIVPFLGGGPLLRSGTIPANGGGLVALAGSPVDLVVATDMHVSYVQRSVETRHVVRVSERFVLRIKQPEAIQCLQGPGTTATLPET